MPTSIDSLQIQINAEATKANIAIDRLVVKLDALSQSLSRIPTGNISGLASGIDKLGRSMQVMGTIDSRSFTRLANNISRLSQIDTVSINNASSSLIRLANSFNTIGSAVVNTQNVTQLASALSRLGGRNVTAAITNIPLLATAMNNLMTTLSRSPQVSRNIIDMTNALANLASQGRNMATATNAMVNGLNNSNRGMRSAYRSSWSLASSFGRLYANYFLVIRAIKAFGSAIENTSDYIEAYNYYNVAFGKIAEEWKYQYAEYGYTNAEAYANSFTERMNESLSKMSGLQVSIGEDGTGLLTTTGMKNLGLNIQEVTQYASQLASVTNSVGQTGEVSLIAADAFIKLGADISSLFNIDYSDVMKNLQSGLIGQSRALYKYGIDITNATLQTYAYNLGLEKTVTEMTQMEKMQLRMVAILDQSKVSWGDLANTINSPSNMLRQFKNNLSEVGNVLGQLFIPIMQKAMPIINGFTIALKNFFVNLASFLGIEIDFSSFGQGFSNLEDDTSDLSENLNDIADASKKANAGLRKFDELNNISTPDVSTINIGGLGETIDLTKEISAASEEYQKVWDKAYEKMESKAQDFANSIKQIFKPIAEPLTRFFQHLSLGGWTQAGTYAGDFIVAIFDSITNGLKGKGGKIGGAIGKFLNGIEWIKVFKSVGNFFGTLVDEAINLWVTSFKTAPIETAFFTAFALLNFTNVGKVISGKISTSFWSSFVAAIAGFNIGQWLYEVINKEKIDMTWSEQFKAIKESFTDGSWKEALNLWGTDIENAFRLAYKAQDEWYNEHVRPLLDKAGFAITDFWETYITKPFSLWGDDLANWWNNDVAPWFTLEKWSDLLSKPISAFKDFWEDITGWLDEIEKSWNNLFGEKTGVIGGAASIIIDGGGGIRRSIPAYATGGFPEDGLFMANHNELVGQFSNGKTAVANNEQITQAIADAVYPAVYNAVVAATANNGGNILRIEGDPHGMFKVIVEEWNNESRRTQKNPVPIYSK